MADVKKTVEIVCGANSELGTAITGISREFSALNSVVESIAEPLANIGKGVLAVDTALAAMAVGGMALALKTTLQKFEHQTGLATHLELEGQGMPLPADVQVQVLHVVQEALSNVRKHARARQVWVEVQQGPQWRVEVRDDGCGFEASSAGQDEMHVGLRIMQERASHIGATVEVDSVPGSGTCVVLTLPERQVLAA